MTGISALWAQFTDYKFLLMLALGLFVLLLFAHDKYNKPTDSGALVFGKLPPRLMAPKHRFNAGLHLYMAMMGAIYFFASLIGPQIVAIPQFGVGKPWDSAVLWPLGVAAALTAVTALDDNSLLGRIEARLRRIAHEYALIPAEVRTLAQRFRNAPIGSWRGFSDPQERGELERRIAPIAIADVVSQAPSVDYRSHWVRATLILSAIERLEEENSLVAADEQVVAQRATLDLKRAYLSSLIKELQKGEDGDLQSAVNKNAVELLEAAAAYLAISIFQSSRNGWETSKILDVAGFSDSHVRTANRTSSFVYAVVSTLLISTSAALFAIWAIYSLGAAKLVPFEILPTSVGSQYVWPILCGAFSGLLLYGTVFVIAHLGREAEIKNKTWEENYGHTLKRVWKTAALSIGLLLCVNILISGYLTPDLFISFLIYTAPMAALTAFFFFGYMRRAARAIPRSPTAGDAPSPPGLRGARVIRPAVSLWQTPKAPGNWIWVAMHVALATLMGGLLSYLVSYLSAVGSHRPSLAALHTELTASIKDYPQEAKFLHLEYMAEVVEKIQAGFANPLSMPTEKELRDATPKLDRLCQRLSARLEKNKTAPLFAGNCALNMEHIDNPASADTEDASAIKAASRWQVGLAQKFNAASTALAFSASTTNNPSWAYLGNVAIVFAILSGTLAGAFGTAVFQWRVYQLNTDFDAPSRMRREQLLARHEEERSDQLTTASAQEWLTEPLTSMSRLTRLEAMQYDEYEADFLPSAAPQTGQQARESRLKAV